MKCIDILFPRRCPVCRKVVRPNFMKNEFEVTKADWTEGLICMGCYKKLSFVGDSFCMSCGRPAKENIEYCEKCRRRKNEFEANRGMLEYSDEYAGRMIADLKYHGKKEYADFLALEMVKRYGRYIQSAGCEAIVPVPVHKKKLDKRGYNQMSVIARRMGELMDMYVDEKVLIRNKKTLPQKKLTALERYENLKNAFEATESAGKYKSLLLIDDIYTTGATLNSCSMALKSRGVSRVYCITCCIGRNIE